MKKLIFAIVVLFFLTPQVFAGECETITDVPDYWVEVISGVNIRDKVCDGNVIGTLSTGTKVKVIGHIEGWRYIERPDGGNGFVWSDFVDETNAPVIDSENPGQEEGEPKEDIEKLSDIEGHKYATAIRYLADNEIVEGYPDGTYQPDKSVNRAEFTKIIVGAKLGSEPTSSIENCFPDVRSSDWFSGYVCYAKNNGIISGYPDGTFKPANTINLAEAAKILVNTLNVDLSDDESGDWYAIFIRSLQDLSYIPDSFNAIADLVNRGQMAELVYRILDQITDQPSVKLNLKANSSGKTLACADSEVPASVDIGRVRDAWFSWVNAARATEARSPYQSSRILDATAQAWSDYSVSVGTMSHSRPGQTEYYDYSLITKWFEDLGVTFKNVGGWTYSENIGRTYMNCSKEDCTQELIDSTKLIFNAYMAEKGTGNTAHYDSVMGNFNLMGIAWSFNGRDVYVTVHYAAELNKIPDLTCDL
jgi:uncharacterized protein YkwD